MTTRTIDPALVAALADPARLVYLESTGRWALMWPWGWPFISTATADMARWWLVAWGWSWAEAQKAIVDLGQAGSRRHQETAGGAILTDAEKRQKAERARERRRARVARREQEAHQAEVRRWWS